MIEPVQKKPNNDHQEQGPIPYLSQNMVHLRLLSPKLHKLNDRLIQLAVIYRIN